MSQLEVAYLMQVPTAQVEQVFGDTLLQLVPTLDPRVVETLRRWSGDLWHVRGIDRVFYHQWSFNSAQPTDVLDLIYDPNAEYSEDRVVAAPAVRLPEGQRVFWSNTCVICGKRFDLERIYDVCSLTCEFARGRRPRLLVPDIFQINPERHITDVDDWTRRYIHEWSQDEE